MNTKIGQAFELLKENLLHEINKKNSWGKNELHLMILQCILTTLTQLETTNEK